MFYFIIFSVKLNIILYRFHVRIITLRSLKSPGISRNVPGRQNAPFVEVSVRPRETSMSAVAFSRKISVTQPYGA